MQAEFLEQGTSFHLVSHRESSMDSGDILPGDKLETNLHSIRVWGQGGGGRGLGVWKFF